MTIVKSTRPVTGGVDTHLDEHVAAALDATGRRVAGVESFPATTAGYRDLHGWLAGFGEIVAVGVEGTGAYGVGLARFLHGEAVTVIEVDRPNRQERRRNGKSDQLDAVEAARAALSDGPAGSAKRRTATWKRSGCCWWPSDQLERLGPKRSRRSVTSGSAPPTPCETSSVTSPRPVLAGRVAGRRPRADGDVVTQSTKVVLQTLGRRVLALDDELDRLSMLLEQLVAAAAPEPLELHGVGPDTAATLLVAAGDNAERLKPKPPGPTSAASPRSKRHQDVRPGIGSTWGGNRQANHALWRIVITRMSPDPRTWIYVQRRLDEGLTKAEIIRVLKRYVAREIWRHLPR